MAYKNFQRDNKKYSKADNLFKKPKSMTREKDLSKKHKNKIIMWNTFFRRNIHRFVQFYFDGIKLYWYQYVWLYLMSVSDMFVTIASRGVAKSFVVAIYAVAVAILYPNSEIVISASSAKQALLIITEKIEKILQRNSSNIAREIEKITKNNGEGLVKFHNGSTIKVVTSGDGARGNRSTLNIYDEYRLIKKETLDSILAPFLYSRQAPYLHKEEYQHLLEEPKEIFISSAGFKSEWMWEELIKVVNMHYKGENVNFLAFDYLLTLKHGLKTKSQMRKMREKSDEITFMMEYENIMYGENVNAFFKLDMFKNNKVIKKAFYPLRKDNIADTTKKKKNVFSITRKSDEIRLISVDIATRKGKGNDNTVITCFRLLPTSKGYHREIVYMETHNGENTIIQSLRIKQIYHDFEGDYIVLDLQQAGKAIYDQLGVVTRDEERGLEYDAFTVVQESKLKKYIKQSTYDELVEGTLAMNATPNIFPVVADAKWNNDIAYDLRKRLQENSLSLLVDENNAEEHLVKISKEYATTEDSYIKAWYIHPYAQIREFINETVALEYTIVGGNLRVEEAKRTNRKDRYVSVAYGNYFATLLERDLLKEKTKKSDWSEYFITHRAEANKYY